MPSERPRQTAGRQVLNAVDAFRRRAAGLHFPGGPVEDLYTEKYFFDLPIVPAMSQALKILPALERPDFAVQPRLHGAITRHLDNGVPTVWSTKPETRLVFVELSRPFAVDGAAGSVSIELAVTAAERVGELTLLASCDVTAWIGDKQQVDLTAFLSLEDGPRYFEYPALDTEAHAVSSLIRAIQRQHVGSGPVS